jgi:hypothetical protein
MNEITDNIIANARRDLEDIAHWKDTEAPITRSLGAVASCALGAFNLAVDERNRFREALYTISRDEFCAIYAGSDSDEDDYWRIVTIARSALAPSAEKPVLCIERIWCRLERGHVGPCSEHSAPRERTDQVLTPTYDPRPCFVCGFDESQHDSASHAYAPRVKEKVND